MNVELDIGPLSWVKDEIEVALRQVAAQLQVYAAQKDAGTLAEAREHLHQAHGALAIVGLDGVTEFSRAIENLFDALLQDEASWSAAVGDIAQEAVSVLRQYLQALAAGRPNQPLRLLPAYRRLNEARGVLDTAPSDLFFPDLTQRPPRRASAVTALDESSQQLRLKAARLGFERGLSKWLKQDSSAFRDMRNSIAIIESLQEPAAVRAFWWVALAYFDALAAGGIAESDATRNLCERIGSQVSRLLDGARAVAERLMRDVLYEVAMTPVSSDHTEQVRSAYRLRELVPIDTPAGDLHESVLQEMRECLRRTGESWQQFCAGAAIALPRFHEQSTQLAQLAQQLDDVGLARLVAALANTANFLRKNPQLHTDALGKEMATALLLIENAANRSDAIDRENDSNFANLIDSLIGRLSALQRGEALPAQDIPALQTLAQQSESRFDLHHVVADLRAALQQVELGLDAYFREVANNDVLAVIAASLKKIAYMFEQLGQPRAVEVTRQCVQSVAAFVVPDYQRQPVEFEDVARKISALGFFVEQLQYGHADLDALLTPVTADVITAEPTIEAELTHTKRMARTLVNALRDSPPDQNLHQSLRSELKQNLESVRASARLVADKTVEQHADIALEALISNATPERIEAVVAPLAPDEITPLASAAEPLAKASASEIDDELMAIFLDEARQTLETIRAALAQSAAATPSTQQITTLRRSFHLLKGSSRMLGLEDFSDTVWAVEATLGRHLRSGKPATQELLTMVDTAQSVTTDWVERLQNGLPCDLGAPDTGLVLRQCKELTQGQASPHSAAQTTSPDAASTVTMLKIGPLQLERSTYEASLGELRVNLVTLQKNWQRTPTPQMIHATQNLGNISAALGFAPLQRLANAFEKALERFVNASHASDAAQDTALQMGLRRLGTMVNSIADQHYPRADEEIAAWLDALMPSERVTVDTFSEAGAMQDHDLLSIFLTECQDLIPAAAAGFRAWRNEGAAGADSLRRVLHTMKGGALMGGAREIGEAVHDIETRIDEFQTGRNATHAEIDQIESRFQSIVSRIEGTRAVQTAVAEGQRPMLRLPAELVDTMVTESGEISIARSRIEGGVKVLRGSLDDLDESVAHLRTHLRELEIQAESRIQSANQLQLQPRLSLPGAGEFDPLEMDRFTRLHELTRILAESVNDVATVQHSLMRDVEGVDNALTQQARLSRELTQHLMGARMVPFASITERLQRVVRLTAEEAGKSVAFLIEGGTTEIDRSVLESLIGPIEHLLRNAVVHGIETADRRVAAGKPEQGDVRLSLTQAGNEVVICVSDDGGGLDYIRIRGEAIKRGLLAAGQQASDAHLTQLIYQPGFTTATQLSEIAGRGVGMDAVRNETTLLGGRIEVDTLSAQGAVFTLHLPLTLAVIPVVLVKSGARTFAIPSSLVAHAMEVKPEVMAQLRLDMVTQWKDQRFNLHYLPRLLGDFITQPSPQRRHWMMLLRGGAQCVAIEVDSLLGNEEVVIKNMGPQLARMPGISGATVLADGEVVLIVNPVALVSTQLSAAPQSVTNLPEDSAQEAAPLVVMVVDDSLTVRKVSGRLLERAGYRVITAKDGIDALEQLKEVRPLAMLVDIEMPRMDGFELVRQMRADERFKMLPVIMITSRIADKHRNYALELGVNHYLGKPYDEDELLAILEKYVVK